MIQRISGVFQKSNMPLLIKDDKMNKELSNEIREKKQGNLIKAGNY